MEASEHQEFYRSERISVSRPFDAVFTHFYVAANQSEEPITKTLLPSFQILLVFNFGSPVSFSSKERTSLPIERCLLLGPVKQPIEYTLLPGSEILVANFKGDTFYRFFGRAINEYLTVHPDDLINENCFTGLWHHLKELKSDNDRIDFLLQFCEPYLRSSNAILEKIVRQEQGSSQLDTIKAIAAETGQSERSIQLNHKKHLGYTAKEMTRYRRFLKAVEMVGQIATDSIQIDWFEIIEACNYYDQSHLIHDFQFYLNLSPSEYLAIQNDICASR